MVEIRLDQKENENYTSGYANIKIKQDDYENDFKQFKYEIDYNSTYQSSILGWLWHRSSFYLYFKLNKSQTVFIFYPANDLEIVDHVETYYASKNPDTILVVGFKTRHYIRYYTYHRLKSTGYSTGFPPGDVDFRKLPKTLRDEDDRVNRVKFLNTNNPSKNCKEDRHNLEGNSSLKYCYSVDNKKRYEDHELTKKDIFKYETGIDVNGTYFQKLDGKYFDSVCVYCTREQTSKVLLVEFINGTKNTYFSRQDKYGFYWISKTITNLNDELTNIENKYRDKLTYLIGRKGGYKGITSQKENHQSFEEYKHTPEYDSQTKISLILYNGHKIELETNELISGDKLKNLDKKYSKVCVYFIQSDSNGPPVFIHLTETSNSKNHWLQKVNPNGLVWKEISDPKLDNSIAYRLEVKNNGSYGNGSIQVSELSDRYYKGYSHIPTQKFNNKNAFLFYNKNLIILKTTDAISDDKRLVDPQNKVYSVIRLYYENSNDLKYKINQNIPIFLELIVTGNSLKTYTLFRIDSEGRTWTQIDKTAQDIGRDNSTKEEKIQQLNYHTSKSIIILANNSEKNYSINLIDNSNNNVTDPLLNGNDKKISVKDQNCENVPGFKLYKQTLPTLKRKEIDTNLFSDVTAIRFFIGFNGKGTLSVNGYLEIKTFNRDGKKLDPLYYEPFDKFNKDIYVYFSSNGKLPLLVSQGTTYYKPSSLDKYFVKWIESSELRLTKGCDISKISIIIRELNGIIKNLNQIDIRHTDTKGYGIKKPNQGGDELYYSSEKFDGKLINVNQETQNGNFLKLTHTPINKSTISKLTYGTKELNDDSGQKINIGNNNSVRVYYYKSDKSYRYPLLVYLIGDNFRDEAFYQKVTPDSNINWKKVDTSELDPLKKEDDKLVDKINTIHYNIGKSVMIQVDQQVQGGSGSDKYKVQLVDNKVGGSGSGPTSASGEITVKKNVCTPSNPPLTNYTCFTHTIPSLTESESGSTTHYVSGLKLFICENKYLETYTSAGSPKLPIYYNSDQREVKVYFYQHVSSSTSTNPDKVPLLVEYGGTHFKPKTRDDYFNSWVKTDVSTNKEPRSDVESLPQIGKVLDEVNKNLNTIQLEETGDPGNDSYGIKAPSEPPTLICPGGATDNFCKRVEVTRNGDGGGNYLKVTHKTVNQGPIGLFKHNGQDISGIKPEKETTNCNQVHVYYRANDKTYNQPLLIHITTQGQTPDSGTSCTGKWFHRKGIKLTDWNDAEIKHSNGSNIKQELEKINARMANYICLQIHQQGKDYQIVTRTGTETEKQSSKEHKADISIDSLNACGSNAAENYRCFKHKLKEYYDANKTSIVSKLGLGENEPTLQVRLDIFNNNFLGLHGKDGESTLTNPLVYGKDQSGNEDFNPYVYFFEPGGYGENTTDRVPLMVKFGQNFFGPIDKEKYFKTWMEYTIDSRTGKTADNIKSVLNKITRLLNCINLEKTNHGDKYGDIQPSDQTNPLKANKRVSVTTGDGPENAYHTVTHSTKDTGCVGYVKFNGQELQIVDELSSDSKTWSTVIEEEMGTGPKATAIYNDLTAYHHKSDTKCKIPLLICITGTISRPTPPALFYERTENNDNKKWKKVTSDLRGEAITDKVNQIFYNFNQSVKIELATTTTPGSSYLEKLVQNSKSGTPDRGLSISVKAVKDNCRLGISYTCIKHTVSTNTGILSQVGGLRFYFDKNEVKTFSDGDGKTTKSVFYHQGKNDIHVYLQESTKVPLMFRYNRHCFRPMDKASYFDKWVLESGITSTKSQDILSKLSEIDSMLNDINLDKTGNSDGGDKYGLDSSGIRDLDKFDGKRITVTRDTVSSGKFRQVTHNTNNGLGIGNVKYVDTEVTDNQHKNLSDVVKKDPGIPGSTVNTVTVYYHKTDGQYKTPLLLGFGNKGTGVPETGGATLSVFYERVDSNKPPSTWKKVDNLQTTELAKQTGNEQKIADKLDEIRYRIGKSVVINLTDQKDSGDGYDVQVVENKGSGSGKLTQAGPELKITVTKNENCTGTQSEPSDQPTSKYTCYEHTIPTLTGATDHSLIGGVKFYVCKNQYLPTYGKGGYPPEHIYYKSGQSEVKVYFYSSGHGAPNPDTVPLLVKYGTRYYGPKDRSSYFTSWVLTEVRSTEEQGDTNTIATVLDGINKNLNTVDISKTINGYGLGKPDGGDPCQSIKTFCNRVSAQRDTNEVIKFRKVTHTTTNKFRIGDIYHGTQPITAIDTSKVAGCNQVVVYYGPEDKTCTNPLLICLCKQAEGTAQLSDNEVTTSFCKKWYQRKGIDLTQWELDGGDDPSTKYDSPDKIQKELAQILALFKDYLYLEIDKQGKPYDAYVQAKTNKKVKVGDSGSEKKIAVSDVTDGTQAEENQVQVPDKYKAYKHKLSEFYNGAKEKINQALKTSLSDNHLETQSQNPTLYLRLEIAGQVITLVGQGGSTVAAPLEYKHTDTDSGTGGKKDPIVFFYKTGGGRDGSSTPDWVPLLFHYGGKYYGPLSRASYFNTWKQISITGGEGGGNSNLENKLNDINRELNEIDLTQTGTGSSRTGTTEYGLEAGSAVSSSRFQTKRITVETKDNYVSGTSSKYTTISHKTANGYNIGNIQKLGSCDFDNTHTQKLSTDNKPHNQAVAVYASGDTGLQTPSLVLICSTTSGLASDKSTVHGYYDLSNWVDGKCSSTIEFKTVKSGFTVDDITKRDRVADEKDLALILQRIGIVSKEQPSVAPQLLDSPSGGDGLEGQEEGQEEDDPDSGRNGDGDSHSDKAQDDRPKVGAVPSRDGLGSSDGMVEGAKAGHGASGLEGKDGLQGPARKNGETSPEQPAPTPTQDNHSSTSPSPPDTSNSTTHGAQEPQPAGGVGNVEENRGGASPEGPMGDSSPAVISSGSSGSSTSGSSDSDSSNESIGEKILKAFNEVKKYAEEKPAEFYGGTGGGVGAGVIATAGAVVYKK